MQTNNTVPAHLQMRQTANAERERAPGELGKDDFLKLLTTQLSQQDPLSPVDNQAFVEQLTQMASVERLANISASIEQLALAQSANTSAQMVSLIGKHVEANADSVRVEDGAPSHAFGVELAAPTDETTVVIRDEDGDLVRRIELGGLDAGKQEIAWDGLDAEGKPATDGDYTFEVIAHDEQGEDVGATTYTRRRVTGVVFEGGFPRLTFDGDARASLGEIRRVTDS